MNNREAYEQTCREAEKFREIIDALRKYRLTMYDDGKTLTIYDEKSGRKLLKRIAKERNINE